MSEGANRATPLAIVVAGLSAHERADPVVRGKTNTVREIEEEFPF